MSRAWEVKNLYKQLLFMGRDYPMGAEFFQTKCRNAFQKKIGLTDPQEIDKAINLGYFIVKEIEALYQLRKYRALKKLYYENDPSHEDEIRKRIEVTSSNRELKVDPKRHELKDRE